MTSETDTKEQTVEERATAILDALQLEGWIDSERAVMGRELAQALRQAEQRAYELAALDMQSHDEVNENVCIVNGSPYVRVSYAASRLRLLAKTEG